MNTLLNPGEWVEFLKRYGAAAGLAVRPENPGASEEQVTAAETRLKVTFPPSYRSFLKVSNGWKSTAITAPPLRPVQQLKWFRKEHKDWFEAYQFIDGPPSIMERDYFNYAQPCAEFDVKHLGQTLCISEIGDEAVVLLNPMVVWPDGEWETWFFANWVPGAIRYRSFADWMRHELYELTGETFEHDLRPGELPVVYLDPPAKATRRIRRREEIPVLEIALEKLKSKKDRERIKAAQQLALLGGPEAVAALIDAMKNGGAKQVRWAATEALGILRAPETVESLIAAIDDPFVSPEAIHALKGFTDERSAQRLLKIVEDCGYYCVAAAGVLAERQDARAVKPLVDFLISTKSENQKVQHTGNIAGRIIAQFGEEGFVALEPLMASSDLKVRKRASVGIGDLAYMAKNKNTRRQAYEFLKSCAAIETDEELRRWNEVSIEISAKKNRG